MGDIIANGLSVYGLIGLIVMGYLCWLYPPRSPADQLVVVLFWLLWPVGIAFILAMKRRQRR